MHRILFVDDERHILNGLRRQLHGLRREWQAEFALGGPEAMDMLSASPFDAVVTDMRMPKVDGAQVLVHAMLQQPLCARLVLSGYADPERHRSASICAHRYLDKPCPPELLELEVRHALTMREAVQSLGDGRLQRLWCEPPARESGFVDLLLALDGAATMLPTSIEQLLLAHEEVWAAVRDVLARMPGAAGRPPESPSAGARTLGVRLLLHVLLAVRFLRRFEQGTSGSGRFGDDAVQLAVACLEVARERGIDEDSALDAMVAGLLLVRCARDAATDWLDALAYLLPTNGMTAGCIAALTQGDRPGAHLTGPSATATGILAAARVRCADPAAESLQGFLAALGWPTDAPA